MPRHSVAVVRAGRGAFLASLILTTGLLTNRAFAVVLWNDLGATLAHETGVAPDILGGAIREDDSSTNALYFKFHVDPLSDVSTEKYLAAFELYENDTERLAIGNSLEAWAYSAFNTSETGENNKIFGDLDLHSSRPESSGLGVFLPYELPRRGIERTIVFKVQYIPGADDLVTVWLDPDLSPGATETNQPESLTTVFRANASFNVIRLRHSGGGGGWTFSDMAIATSFADFVADNDVPRGENGGGSGRGGRLLTFQSWEHEQGLPQNSVRALAQTPDGYLWLGSDDGVARFDGVQFVSFDTREGLRTGPVSALLADNYGPLWVGTAGAGLTRWQSGESTTYTTTNGLPSDSINALLEDNRHRVWIGTDAGLAIAEIGKLTPLAGAEALRNAKITTLFQDRRGIVWIGAADLGVFEFNESRLIPLTDSSVSTLLRDPHCLLVDHAGRLWIGAGDDFLLCRDGQQWHRYRIPRHLARPYINTLAEEPDGTVWAGSVSEGLFEFRDGKLNVVNAARGLLDNFVESLLADREGNLWVGTGAGLNRIRPSDLSVFGPADGLGYGAVEGLAEISPGIVWAAKPNDGVYRWTGRAFEPLSAGWPQRFSQTRSLLKAKDGACWIAGAFGIAQAADPASAPEKVELSLDVTNVLSLYEDNRGDIWAGTQYGELWVRRSLKWVRQTNTLPVLPITAIAQDNRGAMWIGTGGAGVFRLTPGALLHVGRSDGLMSASVRALYADADGTIWIGTTAGGLSRWRDGKTATFTAREGLPDNTISQIIPDDSGRLWLGSDRGIACVAQSDLEQLAAGKTTAVYPQIFGRAEGMPSEECAGGFFPAGLRTASGLLWFSTLKGIVIADPHRAAATAPAPNVVLEEVLVDGASVPNFQARDSESSGDFSKATSGGAKASSLTISPGKHRLEFRFTGLNFTAPERIRFRYRLEGLDPDWVEAGTRRAAFYSYVPPGQYRFHVIACNSSGVWNEIGASLPLIVQPHFWQMWWFIILASVTLLGTLAGAVRVVEKRKLHRRLARLEEERSIERERSRIAQDLHDDLGSSLARISLLSGLITADKDSPVQVETHAARISQSADQTVRALEEIVWAVRPGSDSLQSLIEYIAHFATELFEGDKTRCRLDLPQDVPPMRLPPDFRHNIFLVVKEALTNALKHAGAREVRVRAEIAGSTLKIAVQDDGRGFDPAAPQNGKHHGLENMRQRAKSIGALLTIESANGEGSTALLVVTLRPAELP